MSSPSQTTSPTLNLFSISLSFLACGGIATLSLFDLPILQAQPASRSLPSTRWLFSRGSHLFPQAAALSSAGFAYLAYTSLPSASRTFTQLVKVGANGGRVNGYLLAAALAISIGPFTSLVMVPTNFELIKLNEKYGGARSEEGARVLEKDGRFGPGERSAEDSVNSKGEGSQWTDLSGPQERAPREVSKEDEKRTGELLARFKALNMMRAVLIGAGGMVGLWVALGVFD